MKTVKEARLGVKVQKDEFGKYVYRPETNTGHRAPKIIRTYFEGKGKNRVRMYECAPMDPAQPSRIFKADAYDLAFIPRPETRKVSKRMPKGENSYFKR